MDSPEHITAKESARRVLLLCSEVESSRWLYGGGRRSSTMSSSHGSDDTNPNEAEVEKAESTQDEDCTMMKAISQMPSSPEIEALRQSVLRTKKTDDIKYRKLEIEHASLKLELANVKFELEQANLQLRKANSQQKELQRDLEKSVLSKGQVAQLLSDENFDMMEALEALRKERDEARKKNAQLENWILQNSGQLHSFVEKPNDQQAADCDSNEIGNLRRIVRSWSSRKFGQSNLSLREGITKDSASTRSGSTLARKMHASPKQNQI